MNVLIISESFIVRDSLKHLFKDIFSLVDINIASNVEDFNISKYNNFDFIFIDSNIGRDNAINIVSEAKIISEDIKVVILDARKDKELFLRTVKSGVDGYILNILDKDEFIYIIKKVVSGKKFYDSELLQYSISSNSSYSNIKLTNRESSVLSYVCKGMSNKEIAKILNVTDYTIKKHVSSILSKLNLKNRQDIIIYSRDNNLDSNIG